MGFTSIFLILIYIAAVVISIAVTYYIIQAATETKKRFKYEMLRTKLLVKMAEKAGVSKEEIDEIIDTELA